MDADFTFEAYARIVAAAAKRYRFVGFGDTPADAAEAALWRHDIDFSPQRALKLAEIEAAHGVTATYFVQMSSRFYNPFEPEIAALIRGLVRLGHAVGLHYDPEVCAHIAAPDHVARIAAEAKALESIAEAPVASFSLHNPTTIVGVAFDAPAYAGLINGSAPSLRETFAYCSDSNGIWRYRSLPEMIADPTVGRLYALTHPEWWQDEPMSPRQRIQRCIDGRKTWSENYYDALLFAHHRPNIGSKET